MNPFRPLRKLLDFVLGEDLPKRAPEKKRPDVRPPAPRTAAPQGDGFDSGSRGPRVDLRGGVKVPVVMPDEPAGPPAAIPPSDFSASLDDLALLTDDPMEPRPEFIPKGGMSTESLMREFESLDAETQAAGVEAAAARELATNVDAFEPASELPPSPIESAHQDEGQHAEPPAPDAAPAVDEPLEPKPALIPEGALSTESLMSGFASLDADPQAATAQETATTEAVRVEPAAAPIPPQPAFVPSGGLSTESLMSEFESIDAETREAAIAEAAANELARRQAEEAARADEQVDSFEATSPQGPGPEKKNEAGD
ncbi:MAG: hypothetical protein Q8N26_28955 [Myxococcales bacterium]|nr:hypothetical protein [Myxococcales bacterium]